jgi:hypothetical protein
MRVVGRTKWLSITTFIEKYNVKEDTIYADSFRSKNSPKYQVANNVLYINESYILKKLELYRKMQHQAHIFYYALKLSFSDRDIYKLMKRVEADNDIGSIQAWNQFFTEELFRINNSFELNSEEGISILNPRMQYKLWIFWRCSRWIFIKGAKKKGKKYSFKELENWLYKE